MKGVTIPPDWVEKWKAQRKIEMAQRAPSARATAEHDEEEAFDDDDEFWQQLHDD